MNVNKGKKKTFIFVGSVSIFVVIIIIVFLIFPTILFYYLIAPPWQGIRQTESDFEKNKESIFLVKDYLVNSGYDSVHIYKTMKSGEMSIGGEITKIEDDELVKTINKLKKRGYSSMAKSGNGIRFVRWTGKDVGKGVVYSIDGHTPDEETLQFLTKIEPLQEDGWYYYEEDYNEWRKRNNE